MSSGELILVSGSLPLGGRRGLDPQSDVEWIRMVYSEKGKFISVDLSVCGCAGICWVKPSIRRCGSPLVERQNSKVSVSPLTNIE